MTTTSARLSAFDIATIPSSLVESSVEAEEGEMLAQFSFVFRPNGLLGVHLLADADFSRLVDRRIVAAMQPLPPSSPQPPNPALRGRVRALLMTDPAALNTGEDGLLPDDTSGISPADQEALRSVTGAQKRAILWAVDSWDPQPIAEKLIDRFGEWLADFPAHLRRAAEYTVPEATADDVAQEAPTEIDLCTIVLPQGAGSLEREIIKVPCSWLKNGSGATKEIELDQKVAPKELSDLLRPSEEIDFTTSKRALTVKDITDSLTPTVADEIWKTLFPTNRLNALARALLFPGDPSGARDAARMAAKQASRATLRSDQAYALHAGLSEIKSAEVIRALDAATRLKRRSDMRGAAGFDAGLTPGDLVGTVHSRLLGTVRAYEMPRPTIEGLKGAESFIVPVILGSPTSDQILEKLISADSLDPRETFEELETSKRAVTAPNRFSGTMNDEEAVILAEKRRAATLRSLAVDDDLAYADLGWEPQELGSTVGQRRGYIRPGFGQLLFNHEEAQIKRFSSALADEQQAWKQRFSGAQPINRANSFEPDNLGEDAGEAAAEALKNAGALTIKNDPFELNPFTKEATPAQKFGRVMAAAALARRRGRGQVGEDTGVEAAAKEALKRFQELYAHPVLAEGLGLVRDYEVTLEALQSAAGSGRFIRIGAVSFGTGRHAQTASFIDTDATGTLAFRPAGHVEWFAKEPDPLQGLVDLTETYTDLTPRYSLQTLDEVQMLKSMTLAANATTNLFLAGDMPDTLEDHLPQVRHYGIALIDRGRLADQTARLGAAIVADKWAGTAPMLVFAENLTIGLRLDIGIEQGKGRTAWFDAGDRDIEYFRLRDTGTNLSLSTSDSSQVRQVVRHRSTAYVTPINRYVEHPDATLPDGNPAAPGGRPDIVAQETLVAWQGRSIAVPRRPQEDELFDEDWFAPMVDFEDGPLPIEMDYREASPDNEDKPSESGLSGVVSGLAPLRAGAGYFFGARPVFLDRGGPTLEEAVDQYDGLAKPKAIRLGAGGSQKPLIFGRNDPAGAPEVLISDTSEGPAREPLFVSHAPWEYRNRLKHGENSTYLTQWPGNAVETLILRSEGGPEDSASESTDGIDIVERYIIPPRVDIDTAEVAGVLDTQSGERLIGFLDDHPVRRTTWSGGFPVAVGGEEVMDPNEPNFGEDPLGETDRTNNASGLNSAGPTQQERATRGGVLMKRTHNKSATPGDLVMEESSVYVDFPFLRNTLDETDQANTATDTNRADQTQDQVDYPYFPDPLANMLCVMPLREGLPLLEKPVQLEALPGGFGWPGVSPCIVQLMRPGAEAHERTTFFGDGISTDGMTLRKGSTDLEWLGEELPTVGLWLDDGRACQLALWFAPAHSAAMSSHQVFRMAMRSAFLKGMRQAGGSALNAERDDEGWGEEMKGVLQATPVRGLVTIRSLSLQNAVRKPLAAPVWKRPHDLLHVPLARVNLSQAIADKLAESPTLPPETAAKEALNDWLNGKSIGDKMRDGTATDPTTARGARNVVFGGEVTLHRPSTGKVRIEARWKEWLDIPGRPLLREETHPLRCFRAVEPKGWTILDGTETSVVGTDALSEKPVDLLRYPDGTLRALMHDFLDTKARRLQLRVSAISRHQNRFASEGVSEEEFITTGIATEEFTMPATARPATPVLAEQMLPTFREERVQIVSQDGKHPRRTGLQIERHAMLRYFFKRPWFDAGFDQRLAVLLWDGALFDPTQPSNAQDAAAKPELIPKELKTRVSLHGRDPKFESSSLTDFLTGVDFLNDIAEERMSNLEVPGAFAPGGKTKEQLVSAALFPVELDRERDIWISDIHMRAADSYMPFVRLSLAAAQHTSRSLSGLELSEPVAGWGRVPPRRTAQVSVAWKGDRPGTEARVVVSGGIYRQRNPGLSLIDDKHLTDRPWLEIIFIERKANHTNGGWIRARGDGVPQLAPIQYGAASSTQSDNLWDIKFELPNAWLTSANDKRRGILIREFEVTAGDADGPIPALPESDPTALMVSEVLAVSPDGLSSVSRGKTTYASLIDMQEIIPIKF